MALPKEMILNISTLAESYCSYDQTNILTREKALTGFKKAVAQTCATALTIGVLNNNIRVFVISAPLC